MLILETERLALRQMEPNDYDALCQIMRDAPTMYAYNGAFTDEEVREWLERQLRRYRQDGFGLWAMALKQTGEVVGQCGLSLQPWRERRVLEVGYLVRRDCWRKGYASEAAIACKRYAFDTLHAAEVTSVIRDSNAASQGVARRNGMQVADEWVKHYRGEDMPHLLFAARRAGDDPVRYVPDPNDRARIAAEVLAALPDWFGIPENTTNYIETCRELPFWVDERDGATRGFVAMKATSPYAAEIYVMGVKPEFHRQGVGLGLWRAFRAFARARGFAYAQVKTVQTGRYEEYDRTNRFYQALGFRELECFPTLWDEANPCQLYVQYLGGERPAP